MRFATLTILAVAVLGAACDGGPVQPSRLSTPAVGGPTATSATTVTITGRVVDEHGNGVAAATMFTYQAGSARTDGDGRYTLDVASSIGVIEAKVEHPGYERHERFLRAVTSPQDFLLRDIIRMAPGESRQVVVTPDDSLYGFDFEYRRRTVRVLSPVDATVEFEVVADDARHPEGVAVGMTPTYPCCSSRMTLAMKAGQEISVHALTAWTSTETRSFTLGSRPLQ